MIGDGDGSLRKHGYACLCLCVCVCAATLATWKWGRVFDRVFFLGTLKNCPPVFVSFFRERAYFLFKTTAMERFFYSIVYIASYLIGFLVSRSLTLSISKQHDSVHSISLLTGGHRSGRIPSAVGGEEVQHRHCRHRRRRKPLRIVLSEPVLARTKILHAIVRCRRVGISSPPA